MTIKYILGDRLIARRADSAPCFNNGEIALAFDGLELSAAQQILVRVRQYGSDSEFFDYVHSIDDNYMVPQCICAGRLVGTASIVENGKVCKMWQLEPLQITTVDKLYEQATAILPDFETATELLKEQARDIATNSGKANSLLAKLDEIELRLTEIEKSIATLTEVMI